MTAESELLVVSLDGKPRTHRDELSEVGRLERPEVAAGKELAREDDEDGRAKDIQHEWVVAKLLPIGYQDGNGKIYQTDHLILRATDFVDVEISIDTICRGRGGNSSAYVSLTMHRLIRLQAATEVKVSTYRFELRRQGSDESPVDDSGQTETGASQGR